MLRWRWQKFEGVKDNKKTMRTTTRWWENGKSVNGKRQKMAKVFKKATVVCVPKCPEWRWCISVFFFPLSLLHNFERSSTLLAHTLSFYLHPEIKFDIPWTKIKQKTIKSDASSLKSSTCAKIISEFPFSGRIWPMFVQCGSYRARLCSTVCGVNIQRIEV